MTISWRLGLRSAIAAQIFCVAVTLTSSLATADESLRWRVKNPYLLFHDPADWSRLAPMPCSANPSPCDKSVRAWYDRVFISRQEKWPDPRQQDGIAHFATAWHPGVFDDAHSSYAPGAYESDYVRPSAFLVEIAVPEASGMCLLQIGNTSRLAVPCGSQPTVSIPFQGASIKVTDAGGKVLTTGEVKVAFMVVAGLGDSYSAGEGNPDRPAKFIPSRHEGFFENEANQSTWINRYRLDESLGERPASWWDDQCHRSLYAAQNMAAMWWAADNPHRAIAFVHLACSGAGVTDGLLTRQAEPPGGGDWVDKSQLQALRDVLCKGNYCVRVDRLMFGIGGNDSGFGPVARYAILPSKSRLSSFNLAFVKLKDRLGKTLSYSEANDRIRHSLAAEYDRVAAALRDSAMLSEAGRVLVTGYPNPLHREDGSFCGQAALDACNEQTCRVSVFDYLQVFISSVPKPLGPWQLQIGGGTPDGESEILEGNVIEPLNAVIGGSVIARSGEHPAWTFVDSFVAPVLRHGICAVAHPDASASELGWPVPQRDGSFVALRQPLPARDPSQWDPYEPSARWFRTPNDTILTQTIRTTRAPAETGEFNGMLHPTAETHVAIAQALVEAMDR